MDWRELRQTGEIFELAGEIWRREQSLPLWFRESSKAWTRTGDDFFEFVGDCQEVWSLEDKVFVYVERQTDPRIMQIHLSVLERKFSPERFVRETAELRDLFFRRGVRCVQGWALARNFALVKLMGRLGFEATGLFVDHGRTHGGTLRWQLMRVGAAG